MEGTPLPDGSLSGAAGNGPEPKKEQHAAEKDSEMKSLDERQQGESEPVREVPKHDSEEKMEQDHPKDQDRKEKPEVDAAAKPEAEPEPMEAAEHDDTPEPQP